MTFSSADSMVTISSHPSSVFSGPWKTGSENFSFVSPNWKVLPSADSILFACLPPVFLNSHPRRLWLALTMER